jgi:hypothetical protein
MRHSQPNLKGGCVYALADPRKPKVWRYVGQSFRPVARRTQHVGQSRRLRQGATAKERWIADLLSDGLHPRVIVLECDILPSELGARERAWIARSLKDGHPLTNALLYRKNSSLLCEHPQCSALRTEG